MFRTFNFDAMIDLLFIRYISVAKDDFVFDFLQVLFKLMSVALWAK